jgi:hypothetical protein
LSLGCVLWSERGFSRIEFRCSRALQWPNAIDLRQRPNPGQQVVAGCGEVAFHSGTFVGILPPTFPPPKL